MKETFSFPASVQSDLFGYLKPHQQAIPEALSANRQAPLSAEALYLAS